MCGILGGNIQGDYLKALEIMKYRGPDGHCIVKNGNFTMAFCRLSIIDLSDEAMQPMISEDGSVYVVFNGEIYGFKDIRERLKNKYHFKTNSDTEIILALYSVYGIDFINKIDGMFALAILDIRQEHLLLYRDRAGIKPLYYYYDDGMLLFGSELKALKSILPDGMLRIDNTSVYDYFSYGYVPEPKTIYRNVYKVEPANYVVFDLNSKKISKQYKYWEVSVNTSKGSTRKIKDIYEEYRHLILESVKEQIVSDVPLGVFFSGGIDSSILSYEVSKLDNQICTYSIGFKDPRYSEDQYINDYSKRLGIVNKLYILGEEEFDESLIKKYVNWFDEPYDDFTAIPTFLLSKCVRNEVTVALSGDGNDELFGGYQRYKRIRDRELDLNARIRNTLSCIFNKQYYDKSLNDWMNNCSVFEYVASCYGCFPDRFRRVRKKLLDIPEDYDEFWFLRKYYNEDLPIFTRMRYLDFNTYLVGDILSKTDRTSMSASIEVRVPFLSKRIIEFAFSLSEDDCNKNGELKRMVKQAYKGILPQELLYREKHGFTVPNNYIRASRLGDRRYNVYRDFLEICL